MKHFDIDKYTRIIENTDCKECGGKVSQVVGLTVEAVGLSANIGDICKIYTKGHDECVMAEVVGFKEKNILLMPFGNLSGIGPENHVSVTDSSLKIAVGPGLCGRILDALGKPMDGLGGIEAQEFYPIDNAPPNPLTRGRIKELLPLGIKAIDSMLTVGRGQRVGIFAGSGVGKSTLLGMIARNTEADINVITLVGERGREVREFIEKDLKEEGLKKSIVVVATSDQPALLRLKSAMVGTAIAEYFRDQGKDVLLLMDSLTRFAMAQREIGMAIGEPPISRGFTPSVYSVMPKLLERSGASDKGSITGLYTVLVEGDDMNEPISDTVRGILDGHIVLSRKLANSNHYPSIDVLESVSRLMPDIVDDGHMERAGFVKRIMAAYRQASDLISIGAYKSGSSAEIDRAIELINPINEMLRQQIYEQFSIDETLGLLNEICDR